MPVSVHFIRALMISLCDLICEGYKEQELKMLLFEEVSEFECAGLPGSYSYSERIFRSSQLGSQVWRGQARPLAGAPSFPEATRAVVCKLLISLWRYLQTGPVRPSVVLNASKRRYEWRISTEPRRLIVRIRHASNN
jgi:hypothetical protein